MLLVKNFVPRPVGKFRLCAAVFGDRRLPVGRDQRLLCRYAMLEQIGCQTCVHLLDELAVVSSAQKAEWLKSALVVRVKFIKGEEELRRASLKEFREAD